MILEREQINRYLRHIIIPEISGPGQKKLLESSVFVCGENVNAAAAAIYYLAAAGVGHINCHFDDPTGIDKLSAGLQDLNGDVSFGLSDGSHGDLQIYLGRPEFIVDKQELISTGSVPAVVSLYSGWKGVLQIFTQSEGWRFFPAKLAGSESPDNPRPGEVFSNCLSGALCAMEAVKLLLGIEAAVAEFLYFNLLTMEFLKDGNAKLEQRLQELGIPEQPDCPAADLGDRKVLIVGAGGLGSPAAYALALAGVGTVGLVDYDSVEISNLNRQILHAVSRLGMPKVESAALFLRSIKPDLTINCYNTSLSKENIFEIIGDYDVVIDAVDNFTTRFLLNDACFFAGKPLIDAGVIRFDGTFRTILPRQGPCYRCTLPAIPAPGSIPSCAESGVLGPVPGIMGFIQAAEAVKLLAHQGDIFSDRMLFFDGMFSDFCTIKLSRNSACPLCGTRPAIHELQEYVFICPDDSDEV